MLIYSNGCSHTAKYFQYTYNYIDIISDVLVNNKDYIKIDIEEEGIHPFKNKLFKFIENFTKEPYDALFMNAKAGKSNDLIFYETYNFVKTLVTNNIKLDYAIIQFSGVNRRFYTTADGMIINVTPAEEREEIRKQIKFEPIATEQSLQYMLILQDLLKSNNIKYCFIPYMEFDSTVIRDSSISKLIDTDFLIKDLELGCRNEFRKNGLSRDHAGHPNVYGYYEIAKLVLEKLNLIDKLNHIDKYFTKLELDHHYLKKVNKDLKERFIKEYGSELGEAHDSNTLTLFKKYLDKIKKSAI